LADWHVEILGSDISEKCLTAAQAGVFPSFSFRGASPLLLKRYFKEKNNQYVLDPEIREMVGFELHNLKDMLAARRHGIWDVIFCRNVLIYFDDEMKTHVATMFHDQLADDGYLLIGHSESLRQLNVPLQTMEIAQAFAYRKLDAAF